MASRRAKQDYRSAGVNINAADKVKKNIARQARSTFVPEVLSDLGFFGGLFELEGYREPVLVSSTDGVGTKIKIACALNQHSTVGIDLVNHCVNDILTCGAKPLFFLDYIAVANLVPSTVNSIVDGLTTALRKVGCALVGGETAQMPDVYRHGEYDLVGFIVGVVEKSSIVNGNSIGIGDVLIGLPSSGVHTNGYSLVRMVFNTDDNPAGLECFYPELGRTLGEELLEPHECYYHILSPHLPLIKGMAHITGGGIPGNLPRVLPQGLAAKLHKGSWHVLPIFELIQNKGSIDKREMYSVFNMGIGMIVVCTLTDVNTLLSRLPGATVIGEVMEQKGRQRVVIS